MGPKISAAAALVVLTIGAGSASAHHSVAGRFDGSRRTEITGTISRIDWINPHTYVYLDVRDEQGNVTTWRLESLPTTMLERVGLTSEMLMAGGATVTAGVLPARDASTRLAWLLKLTYADGHFYQLAGE
ncbi:MAG TPA: DUF6152 family protein [Gammaproteobacteria bacterium]|jgi:hypothetical protein|nr:DUF6152 family protein [Gammaproteobacteria bacterium]